MIKLGTFGMEGDLLCIEEAPCGAGTLEFHLGKFDVNSGSFCCLDAVLGSSVQVLDLISFPFFFCT